MNLSTRFMLLGLCLILLALPLTLFAQDLELTETFISSDGEVTFNYPDGWTVEESENGIILLLGDAEHGGLFMAFLKPAFVVGDTLEEALEELLVPFEFEDVSSDDFVELKIGDRDALRVDYNHTEEETIDTLLGIDMGDGQLGVIYFIVADDKTKEVAGPVLAIAETFVLADGSRGSTANTTSNTNSLTAHASDDPEDAIAELVELGLVSEGGSLVFQEDSAFFTGRGSWFTPLASRSPNTHVVMAGTLSFTIGDASEVEKCSLTARIRTNSNGDATTFVDVGLTNEGNIIVIDRFSANETPNATLSNATFDLTEAHHLLIILVNETVSVYVDGELAMSDYPVVEQSGAYGIALLGAGANARCEGDNIWVYRVPSANPEVCTVSSASAVNKRSGTGTNFDAAGQLPAGETATVIGQAEGADGQTWWQLEDENWVREDVVTEEGDCADVAQV